MELLTEGAGGEGNAGCVGQGAPSGLWLAGTRERGERAVGAERTQRPGGQVEPGCNGGIKGFLPVYLPLTDLSHTIFPGQERTSHRASPRHGAMIITQGSKCNEREGQDIMKEYLTCLRVSLTQHFICNGFCIMQPKEQKNRCLHILFKYIYTILLKKQNSIK